MKLVFGGWEPDKPQHLGPVPQDQPPYLLTADNVFAGPNGYRPVQAFSAIAPALTGDFQGGATFVASDGTTNLLAGNATNLYRFNSSLAWASIIGSLTANRWYFTQFGDLAVAVNGGAPIKVDLLLGTAAALGGSPPTASFVTTVRDFVVLGQADGNQALVEWSGFNDAEGWTDGVNQSGNQPMLTGGAVTGLAGGEYGLIFQRARITRMTYVSEPLVWQFDEISANVGCIAAGSIVQAGRLVFFLSERGFMVTEGNDVTPIGAELIDRTFLESYSREDLAFMYGTADPKNHLAIFSMPGKLWIYNWLLKTWSTSTWAVKAVLNGFTAGVTLEDLNTLYPSGLDSMDPVSLDDARFKGGSPLLLAVNSADEIGTLTGDRLAATFEFPFFELIQGRTARIRRVRPITDAVSGITVTFDQRQRLGDNVNEANFGTEMASGDVYCRVSGRFVKPQITIAADEVWSYAQGLDVTQMAAGGRR